MADEVLKDLQRWYQPLVGMTFQATYQGVFTMPQTGQQRDVLVIGQGNPSFHATLSAISSAVLTKYDETVWKGITGPEDRKGYTNYWLWVEPDFSGQPQVGLQGVCTFQIAQYSLFTCGGGTFSYGVSIKVQKLSQ